jgi:sulfonate transport system substrate-binding protein
MREIYKLAQAVLAQRKWLAIIFGGVLLSNAADGKLLRIGYQKSGAFLLVRSEGTLEKALTPLGYRVEWKEFTDGPTLIEALNAGSIDIGHSGNCPVIVAQAAGVPLLYIGSSKASPDSEAILVPKNSPLQSVADLKGKKVAFDRGSSGHYLVAAALESAGLTLADIQPIYLNPPNARAAFQSGTVDAWSIWDPFFAAAEIGSGARVLVSDKAFSSHREYYFGRKDYLEKNPEIVGRILAVLNETGERALKDPQGTAAFLSDKLGIPYEILLRWQLRNSHYDAFPLTDKVIAEQQQAADFLFQQGVILKPVKIADAVYRPETSKGTP